MKGQLLKLEKQVEIPLLELNEDNKDVTGVQDHAVIRNDLKPLLQKKRWQDAVEK